MINFLFTPPIGAMLASFDAFGSALQDFEEPLKRSVKEVLMPSIAQNFDAGGRPPWEPNAEGTVRVKGHNTVLVNSGDLQAAAQSYDIWAFSRDSASVETLPQRVWYGIVQQNGGPPGRANFIPARPFIQAAEEDLDEIVDIFEEWGGEMFEASF